MIRSSRNVITNDKVPPFSIPKLKRIKSGSVLAYDAEKKAFTVQDMRNVEPLEISGFDYFIGDGVEDKYPITWYADSPERLLIFINGQKILWTEYQVYQNIYGDTQVKFNQAPDNGDVIEIYGVDQIPFSVAGVTNALVANIKAENKGLGEEVYAEKAVLNSIHTLKFKSFIGGNNVDITSDDDEITININESDIVSSIPNASTGDAGIIRIATSNEVSNGTDDSIAVTPKALQDTLNDFTMNAEELGGHDSGAYARQILSSGSPLSKSLVSKATASPDSTFELYGLRAGNGIVVVNVDEDLIVSNKNGGEYIKVVDNYEITNDKFIIGVADTSSPRTITLPNTAQVGRARVINVKDESGNANSNNITIEPKQLNQTIDGQTSYVINEDYQSVTFYCDGDKWFVIDVQTSSIPSPGGDEYSVQTNKGGGFFGSIDFTYDDIKKLLTVSGGLVLKNHPDQQIGVPDEGSAIQYVTTEEVTIDNTNYLLTKVKVKMSDGTDHILSSLLTQL